MNNELRQRMRDELTHVEGKRMCDLTPAEQADAYELWLIDNFEAFEITNEKSGEAIEFMLSRNYQQRLEKKELANQRNMLAHQRNLLMERINNIAKSIGLIRKDEPLKGGEHFMILSDLKDLLNRGPRPESPFNRENEENDQPEPSTSGPSPG